MPKICGQPCAPPCKPIRTSVLLPGEVYGNPQLGRTEASAKDLKQQVEILAANYKEIAEVLRGV